MTVLTRRQILAAPAVSALTRLTQGATLERIPLGVTTDEIDDDVLTAIRFLQRFGLKHAEVRNIWGKYNTAQPIEKVREARDLFREHGIRVSVLGTAFFKIPLPADNADGERVLGSQWELLNAAFERAKLFGTDKIRVFGFTYRQGEEMNRRNLPRIYELLREAARRARAQKFRLALENVSGSYIATGAQAGEMLQAIREDALGLTWDPNNAGQSGEKAFPDGYRALDPARIFHIHLRDYRHRPDGRVEWAAVGQGEFDNLGQLRALLKDGYRGSFTLETHWRSPKGKAFSTETSLTALLKVIEKV